MPKPSPKPVTGYQIERSMQAYRDLVAAYDLDPNLEFDQDAQGRFLHATGAEPPHQLLSRLIDDTIEIERKAEAAAALKKRYTDRQKRMETRAELARTTINQLFDVLELTAWEAEEGSATLRKGPVSVVITDVDKLPPEFVEISKSPKRILIGPKLKAGETVAGAELSNPAQILAIIPF